MNQDILNGKWNQMKGGVIRLWGKCIHDDLIQMHGEKDQLIGQVQEIFGKTKEQVKKQMEEHLKACEC